ncbi:MAG: hypothetical protein ABJD07_06075 [Gemmatimonadaceae bacterium]
MAAPRPEDMRAGFTGLVIAVVCIGALLFGIVKLTNAKYSHEAPAATGAK